MKRKIIKLLIAIFLMFGLYNQVNADSLIGISASQSANVGDEITVNVNVSNALTGKYGVSVSNNASVSTSAIWVESGSVSEGGPIVVTPKSAGNVTVTLTAVSVDNDGEKYTGGASTTINVEGNEEEQEDNENNNEDNASSNNTNDQQEENSTSQSNEKAAEQNPKLASITVNGKTYKNPSNDFTIPSVDAEVSDINIEAVAKDENAKVTVIGNTGLKEGKTNTITITVSTDNGDSKYYIRVPKSVKLDDEQPNIIEENTQEDKKEEKQEEVKPALKSLKIKSFSLTPKFSTDVYSYTVEVDMDKKDVEKLDITAVANDDKFKVEISGNEKFVEGENIVNITVSNEDDTETATYQIKVNKIVKSSEVVGKTQYIQEEKATSASTVEIIIIAIAVIGAILGIIFAVVEYRYTNNNNNDDDDDENDRFFNFDKQMDFKEKDENTGYIEELYHSQDIEEKYDDYEEDKHKKKSKGKHF